MLSIGQAGCDNGCVIPGEDGESDKANLACLPDEGDERYACANVCATAASCEDFPANYDVGACAEECEGAKSNFQPVIRDEYDIGIACMHNEGGPSCLSLQQCRGKTGVPVPPGYWADTPDWRVTQMQPFEFNFE